MKLLSFISYEATILSMGMIVSFPSYTESAVITLVTVDNRQVLALRFPPCPQRKGAISTAGGGTRGTISR